MAVIWQKKIDGTRYQVRSAGSTLRLYTNNVCHSEFSPQKLVTGSIWDLLIIPALFYPAGRIQRVLMLGVGGGACILQLYHLLQPRSITGVEMNPVHLDIARRFFKLAATSAELCEADARSWLEDYRGGPFDMIIDDLFSVTSNEPVRAVEMNAGWLDLLLRHLAPRGLLVTNFASQQEFSSAAQLQDAATTTRFASVFRLSTPLLDNVVGAFTRIDTSAAELRKNISAHPLLGRALQTKQLRYRVRRFTGS